MDNHTTVLPAGSPARRSRIAVHDEEGAQAVEYAMIGGLGAGIIGLLWSIISRTGLLDRLVDSLLTAVVDLLRSWF